jgi:hypothetical protein
VRVYSPALACVREAQAPAATAAGWCQASVDLAGLASGLYHCQVRLKRGRIFSAPLLATFYLGGQP